MPDRRIPLPGLHNLRDLGGLGPVAPGRLWRADDPQGIGADGVATLRRQGLGTVIDLREPAEAGPARTLYPTPLRYHNAPLFGGLNLAAPEIVEAPDPLLALYLRALEDSAAHFASALRLVAEAPAGAVLVHCTVGKDRTGMMVALMLRLAGVPDAQIVADYAETGRHIGPVLERLRARAVAHQWDLALLSRYWRSEAETMHGFLAALDDRHGGAEGYLSDAGLTPSEQRALRLRLTRPHDETSAAAPASDAPLFQPET
ncbi:tyrosine-protein phosphatase [Cereibacter sphaeroides]|nr:tyrosine-protein phosphatase [Cereibacter sphaeroides]